MNTEEALRASLQAHAEQIGRPTAADPWLRVDRAHRRSRTRRRAALAGTLAAVLATGAAATGSSWSPIARQGQPADRHGSDDAKRNWFDDSSPRGDLGADLDLRTAVISFFHSHPELVGGHVAGSPGVQILYAGEPHRDVLVLARATAGKRDTMYWLAGADLSSLRVLSTYDSGLGAPALMYAAPSGRHALGVVPRGATVSAAHVTIDADGRVHRSWRTVKNDDGVVNVPVGENAAQGPLLLRVVSGGETAYSDPLGLSALQPDGLTPTPLPMSAVQSALAGAPGSGVDAATTGTAAVAELLTSMGATFDRVTVKVLWAGPNPDGAGDIVAVAAGPDGQGRVLHVSGFAKGGRTPRWTYATTIPADASYDVLGWRLAGSKKGHDLVGWLMTRPADETVVEVDGRERTTSTIGGLGVTDVERGQAVTVIHGNAHLVLGPEARDDGSLPYAPGR